ncbi:hypothetical protein SDC9_209841 [bioreactor metagenome]|uniref:YibE/F-like protein n=1 Tax=bioreactor metagenome TaxID=1076179 RepID=A0A645JEF7_9ZZZZ
MMNIFNSKMSAAEVLHTFVGCIGLVLVSPLTSTICGFLYKRQRSAAVQQTPVLHPAEPVIAQTETDTL